MLNTSTNDHGQTTYQVGCDFCDRVATLCLKMTEAMLDAAEEGWHLGRRYYCTECKRVRRYDLIGILEREG